MLPTQNEIVNSIIIQLELRNSVECLDVPVKRILPSGPLLYPRLNGGIGLIESAPSALVPDYSVEQFGVFSTLRQLGYEPRWVLRRKHFFGERVFRLQVKV